MHFQLFFPRQNKDAGACLRSVGLADLEAGATDCPARIGEVDGLLVGWGDKIGYEVARQRWIDSGDGYLVGFDIADPPKPSELARGSMFPGYNVDLGDGQTWAIPTAAELPKSFKLRDGHWLPVRKPQFNEFWDRSAVWFRRLMCFDLDSTKICADAKISEQQLWDDFAAYCVFALKQNYRMTPFIASELGLLDSDTFLKIVVATIDGMAIQEVLDEARDIREKEEAGLKKVAESGTLG